MAEQQDLNPSVNNNNNENNSELANTSSINSNATNSNNTANQAKVISLSVKDLAVLYTAYMPFVSGGGLFIPTKKVFNIGDVLPLAITLMDDANKYSIEGKVIWVTPISSHSKPPGIGVQFTGSNAADLHKKIQDLLLSYGKNNEPTNTM